MATSKRSDTVVNAAMREKDPAARAAMLEAALEQVTNPSALVPKLFAALTRAAGGDVAGVGPQLARIARQRRHDVSLLDAIGHQLESHSYDDDALAVLRLARAAGSKDAETAHLLGKLLVQEGDVEEGRALLREAAADDDEWASPRLELALLERDDAPAAGLALLEALEKDSYVCDVRAHLHRRLGAARASIAADAEAVAMFDDEVAARRDLAEWHRGVGRHDVALRHAQRLVALFDDVRDLDDEEALEEVEDLIVEVHRLAGAFVELVPWVEERCRSGVPLHIAYDVFHGLTSLHPLPLPGVALAAARALLAQARDDADDADDAGQACWRVNEAMVHALQGDPAPLRALEASLTDADVAVWVDLGASYALARLDDDARRARARAYALDSALEGARSARFSSAVDSGDAALALELARQVAAAPEDKHLAAEQLAVIGVRLAATPHDVDEALAQSARAVCFGRWCPNAWLVRAEALVLGGHLDEARACLSRLLGLRALGIDDDAALLASTLAGDEAAVSERLQRARWTGAFPAWASRLREVAGRR